MHTGFADVSFLETAAFFASSLEKLEALDLPYAGIYSGFLGSLPEIESIRQFVMAHPELPSLIDPAMADRGRLYRTYTPELAGGMKRLVSVADTITPNVTEACFLTGTPYPGECLSTEAARELCLRLQALGAKQVILTGVQTSSGEMAVFCCDALGAFYSLEHQREPSAFDGTGDLFASIVGLSLFRGRKLEEATELAARLTAEAVQKTASLTKLAKEAQIRGVYFEFLLPVLSDLFLMS